MAFFPEPVTYAEGHALTCAKKMCKEELLRLKELNDWSVYKKKYSASVLTRIRTLILPLQIWMTIMYNWNEYIFGSTLGGCDDVYEWLVKSSCNRTSKNAHHQIYSAHCVHVWRITDVSKEDGIVTVSDENELLYQGILRVWNYLSSSVSIIIVVFHIYLTFITTEPLVGLKLFEQSIIIFITFITLRFTEPLVLFEYHIIILAISIIMFIIIW